MMRLKIRRKMLRLQEDETADHDRHVIDRAAESHRESKDFRVLAGQDFLAAGSDRARRNDAAIMFHCQVCRVGEADESHDEQEDDCSARGFI